MIVHQSRTAALGHAHQCSAHPHFVVIFCEKFQAKPTLKSTILIHPKFFVSKAFKAIQGFLETFFYFYASPLKPHSPHSAGMMAVMQSPIPTYLPLFTPIPAFFGPPGGSFSWGTKTSVLYPLPTNASLPPHPLFFRQVAVHRGVVTQSPVTASRG